MSNVAHLDFFGNPVSESCIVISAVTNNLVLSRVVSLTPKMVKIERVEKNKSGRPVKQRLVYAKDILIVNSADVLAYVIKHG